MDLCTRRSEGPPIVCGIAGIWTRAPGRDLSKSVTEMLGALVHRGPDGSGVWSDPNNGLALGHRRLSIIDVSEAGAQPFVSPCGRYTLSYNGEIYNFEEIRRALQDDGLQWQWKGHSDTEVFLAAIYFWGIERTLEQISGMFAFALWDAKSQSLFLGRDRLGEKPLYYGMVEKDFLFASELRAFYKHPDWNGEIDRGSLSLLMRHNYVPAPHSIFEGVSKLPPGCFAILKGPSSVPELRAYWSAKSVVSEGHTIPFEGSPEAAVDKLEQVLMQAIEAQMVSDVPLGAFLSGGIDSSTVVSLMQSSSEMPVRTFSIGFDEKGYNEAEHARAVANHLGTDHTELYVSARDAMKVVPNIPSVYSEPFSDSSQIPTFLVCELARRSVTVSLSGDGGDELFSGYTRYGLSKQLWSRLSRMPFPLRKAIARLLFSMPEERIDRAASFIMRALPDRLRFAHPGQKARKLAGILTLDSPEAMYLRLVSHWQSPSEMVLGAQEHQTALTDPGNQDVMPDLVRQMMFLDMVSYLPDDILTKVDRAAMAVSLETRVPMLDPKVVSFAASLPMSILRRDGQGKWPLRQLLYRHVPSTLVDRPKMGFGVPLGNWLRGGLREWADALLSKEKLSHGYFDNELILHHWRAHLTEGTDHSYLLWDVLMFQAWLQEYKR